MELSPRLYHYFVRPKWFTKRYIKNKLNYMLSDYDFKDKVVVDFGCGIGSNSVIFNSKKYIGLDCDKRRIDYAKNMFSDYDFKTLNGTNIDISSKSIDYIIIMAVLHHIKKEDVLQYIKEFKRVLKTGGEIIIIEPCFLQNSPIRNLAMKTVDKGEHIRTERGYIELFDQDIWKVEKKYTFKKCMVYNEIFLSVTAK